MKIQKELFLMIAALISMATTASTITDNPVVHAGASGPGVVDAVVDLIYHSCIFPDDYLFLRRLAYVETRDGTINSTYDPYSYYAGIWKLDRDMFGGTMHTEVAAALLTKYRLIEQAFGIHWQNVSWVDLQKPLYSGLAAMLFLTFKETPIPSSLEEQTSYRITSFSRTGAAYDYIHFSQLWNGACSGTKQADVVFVIDSATTNDNFRRMMNYVTSVVDGLPVSSQLIRVALYQFGSSSVLRNEFHLESFHQIKEDILEAIETTHQIGGMTAAAVDTGDFLQSVLADAFETSGRSNAAKIVVFVTGNQPSNAVSMQRARDMAVAEGVSVITVGVGGESLFNTLATVATRPVCDHQINIYQFQHLKDIVQETQFKICREPMIALGRTRCRLDECRTVAFHMTSSNMTIRANTTCGSGTLYVATHSPRPNQYYWEVADRITTTTTNVASVSATGYTPSTMPYIYATFVDSTSVPSSCYAVIEAVNSH